ncbi:MAG: tetratricopeptide repeat protein [Deltaproteobacteria bacterium]|jgi:Flp pilus assembly protein TadD|nr:tetratricopeptide repeat protein [Deltaproteobacteria bacterium]
MLRVWLVAVFLFLAFGCASAKKDTRNIDDVLGANSWKANEAVMKAAERTGNYEVGLLSGQKELDARPDNKQARIFMARLQTMAGTPDRALYTLEPLKDDANPEARLEWGRALLRDNQIVEAKEILEKLINLDGDLPVKRSARKLYAISQDLQGKRDDAQKLFRELLVERDEPTVRFNLGGSLVASNKFDEAIAILQPLLDTPRFMEARFLTAAALSRKNDKKAARNLLEGYLPEPEIRRLLGEKL